MGRLESIDGDNWEDFVSGDAVLMLGKSDCDACGRWTDELGAFLEGDEWSNLRFGKLLLDQRGLIGFKKANPWIADLKDLPHNVIYQRGERVKEFAGLGLERLTNRLNRVFGE